MGRDAGPYLRRPLGHQRGHGPPGAEHRAFGTEQIEHDRRYELAAEFVDVLQRLWREDEPLSFSGRSSWKLQDAYVTPKPRYARPLLVSATGSDAGIAYAARHSDVVFITSPARRTSPARSRSCPPTPNA